MLDPYVYPGTDILKNIPNIRDRGMLDAAEADYVSLRLREIAENPLPGEYDFNHIARMHKYLFQDIYEWAGEIRMINIEKEEPALGGLSIEYSDKAKIREDLSQALTRMISRPWRDLSLEDKAKYFSGDLAAIWKIHGFREGNTRLAITFCCQFIEAQGIPLDRTIFEKHSTYVRTALVAYSAVFHDLGDLSKKEYLQRIIKDSLESNTPSKNR